MPQIEKVTHNVGPDSTHLIASDYRGAFEGNQNIHNLAIYGFYSEELARDFITGHDVGMWKLKQIKIPKK